jgi:hypothetical protein
MISNFKDAKIEFESSGGEWVEFPAGEANLIILPKTKVIKTFPPVTDEINFLELSSLEVNRICNIFLGSHLPTITAKIPYILLTAVLLIITLAI